MRLNRSMPQCDVIPQLTYPDVLAAVAWLVDVFDFRLRLQVGHHRAQLDIGSGALIVTERTADEAANGEPAQHVTHSVMVRLSDVDAHYHRAAVRGARILLPPADFPYGERQYTVRDLAGHVWTFSQTIADVAPEAWGGNWVADT
jgi:uncharacterized glyoxalase superfamily protein PhnB